MKFEWLHPGILNDHADPSSTFFLLSLESSLRDVMDVLVRTVSVFVLFHNLLSWFLRFFWSFAVEVSFITLSTFSFTIIVFKTSPTKLKLPASLIADRFTDNYNDFLLRESNI